jgi:threonylcarbamoyladenosine tRNA methylthiotransferase MtaB
LFTEEFIEEITKLPKFCPHFHISLQSGCDETLKRMNRKYTTDQYRKIVKKLRASIPDIAITTDIIVGFPGESEEEFCQTFNFVQEMELSQIHVFKYSPRKGTPAAKFKNQIPSKIKNYRSEKMIKLGEKMMRRYREKFINEDMDVLFEDILDKDKRIITGFTSNYIKVAAKGSKNLIGEILPVKIREIKNDIVFGEII